MLVRRKPKRKYKALPETVKVKAINDAMYIVTLIPACGLDVGSIIKHPSLDESDDVFLYLGVLLNPGNFGCNPGDLAFISVTPKTFVYPETNKRVSLSDPIYGMCTFHYNFNTDTHRDLSRYIIAKRYFDIPEEE